MVGRDVVTGLYHLRARQYDPATGRFLTTDPLEMSLTDPHVGPYVYVRNMPTVATDPNGTCLQFGGAGLALAPVTGGASAVVGGGATVLCAAAVGAIAAAGVIGAWMAGSAAGEALADATRQSEARKDPADVVYDPRQDPGTQKQALELLRRTFDDVGNLRPGGGLKGGCRNNLAKCLIAFGVGAALVLQGIAAATQGNTLAEDAYDRCRDPKGC